jgi:hypothetical protein
MKFFGGKMDVLNFDAGIMGSYKIISSRYMVDYKSKEVSRTLFERWFSFPWKPFNKVKTVHYEEPMKTVCLTTNRELVCHPTVYEIIKKAVDEQPKNNNQHRKFDIIGGCVGGV